MIPASIFVTGDAPLFVELIKELLVCAGYRNAIWQVGDSAFPCIRDEQPALVLLDISMKNPGRGWALLNVLRLHPKTRHIPVILCSADMRLVNEKLVMLHDLNCQTLEKPFEL